MTLTVEKSSTYVRINGDIPAGGIYILPVGIWIGDDSIPTPVRLQVCRSVHDDVMREAVAEVVMLDRGLPPGGIFIEALGSYITGVGQHLTKTHPEADDCHERGCSVHAPSDHSMREFQTNWRGDRALMERMCEHGVGHPDPDHMAYVREARGVEFAEGEGVHGCDGCCGSTPPPID